MLSFLAGELTTIAFCWRLERRDGVAVGLTSHDRDLVIEGLTYRAAPGMTPSAISVTDGFEADTLEVAGALSAGAIAADDLAAGRWDGTGVRLFATDWRDTGQRLHLARGTLGDVAVRDGAFAAELAGPTAALDRPVAERTSPDCRAALGDRRCRVDLAARTRFARVTAAAGTTVTLDAAEPSPNAYAQGRLCWVDGANSGLWSLVAASAGNELTLRQAPPGAVEAGTLVRLTEGCDRRPATCRDRFGNAANFRGEPFLPGNDLLARYGGA